MPGKPGPVLIRNSPWRTFAIMGAPSFRSGGAGTVYGPNGAMPGLTEYLHCVQLAVDDQALRYQVNPHFLFNTLTSRA